ncbi:hypothetical protein, conserved [Eimeria praecox]|uniref:Uncharacterized protein n=1 Tax=Eimeria praecox TaxID=51316 RepID=U6H9S5_9EIME|nr:hypothetical protein, conserved [Eimeria praecox]
MYADADHFSDGAATTEHQNHASIIRRPASEKEGPSLFLGRRMLMPAGVTGQGKREASGRPLLLERFVAVALLAAAFIILKCAFELGGGRALGGLQRSLAALRGNSFTGACGGGVGDREMVRAAEEVCEFEPEEVTHERIRRVFDLLQELQSVCTALSVGRGLMLQTRIISFYLIVSAQELAAVSGMLPGHLETRRVQLTHVGSNMARIIIGRFPSFAVGDNAFRRITRLLELNNQLLDLPSACTLGNKRCRITLRHLGLVQVVALNTAVTLLRGLLEFSDGGRGPSDQAVSEMLTAMTKLRHTRRVQILGDHGLGPWVAEYLRLGCPTYLVRRERKRQLLLGSSLTPVDVLIRQLEEASPRTVDTAKWRSSSVGAGRTPENPSASESRQLTWPHAAFHAYRTMTGASSWTGSYPFSTSPAVLQGGDLSQEEGAGSNAARVPCHPRVFQLPRGPALSGLTGQSLLEPSALGSEQPSAGLPVSWYSPNLSTSYFQAEQPASDLTAGTQLLAILPTVPSAVVQRSMAYREMFSHGDAGDAEPDEAALRGSAFYGVAQGEPRPSDRVEPPHIGQQTLPNAKGACLLNIEFPGSSQPLQEHVGPFITPGLLCTDRASADEGRTSAASIPFRPLPASQGATGDALDGRCCSALHGGHGQTELIYRGGRMRAAEVFLQREQPPSEAPSPRWLQD